MLTCGDALREKFKRAKDKAIIALLGGKILDIDLPYQQKTTSFSEEIRIENAPVRSIFAYCGEYLRVDEVFFNKRPFIMIECGTHDDVMRNTMEDAEPFPYDLTDEELIMEVQYSLDIPPYPKRWVFVNSCLIGQVSAMGSEKRKRQKFLLPLVLLLLYFPIFC